MKTIKRFAWLLVLALLWANAAAAEEIDANKDVRLSVVFQDNGAGLPDAQFSIFRVAAVDKNGSIELVSPFDQYHIDIENQSESAMAGIASTLEGYALRDHLTPDARCASDQDGKITFSGSAVKQGLYLVLGERYVMNGTVYTIQPAMIQLPAWDAVNRKWNYDVNIHAKYETEPDSPDIEFITRKVLKVWDESCNDATLPEEITVQLLQDGEIYHTVKLNRDNLWRHTWESLDADHHWTVVEEELEDYSVVVSREGITFVVTNSYDPDEPEPTPKPTPPLDDPSDDPKLPQTGQLWWPVAMLTSVGLLLIVIGLIRRRGN